MRIAICDDYQEDIEYLRQLILECEICPKEVELSVFYTGEELLKNFSKFNLIFLDIKLNGINGIQTAELIRLKDQEVPIVFFTNFDLQTSKVIKTHPIHYLIKRDSMEQNKAMIHDVLKKVCNQEEVPRLFVAYGGKTFILPLSDILYISILDKGTAIWLTDERRLEIFGELKRNQDLMAQTIKSGVKLETYYEKLKNNGFIYAKKSYIINAQLIISRYKDSVLLKGGYELTIARSKKKQFDDQFTEFWLKNTIGRQ